MTAGQHEAEIADVLDEISAEIEALGAALCEDPHLCARHVEALQSIDLIAQKQRWLAELMRADCRETLVDSIGVEALQQRFRMVRPIPIPTPSRP